jgi:YYY domain-containing protein
MAGMPLHYYYFGEVLASFPILAAGCSAGVGYNLMAATIPALAAFALASLGLLLAGRRAGSGAIVLPLLVLLTGNIAWPWLLGLARQHRWFDMWWATSRVIPGFAIDEYPLWTTLFADLHGHFIALPVMIATLAWGWLVVDDRTGRWPVAAALAGISAAVLVATNPWDIFVLAGALGTGAIVVARRPWTGVARLAVAAAVSVLAAVPFIVELVAGLSAGAGQRGLFLTDADFAPWWAVLRHFGVFLLPLAALAFTTLGRRAWLVLPVAGIGAAAGLSFGSSAAALGLAAAALFGTTAASTVGQRVRLAWTMAALAAVAVAACERFTLIDRMNTLFKVYNGVWLLLAAALATLVVRSRGRRRALLLATWLPLQAAALVNLPLGIAQGWLQPRMPSPRPTLDGQAFLRTHDPETWFFARALQGAARPGEVVAESAGISYSRHTRIAMHTGQPAVVGWEWHLTQRGQSPAEIKMRFADLETLYAGRDPEARRAVLDRHRVRWVVLGDLERRVYGLEPLAALDAIPGVVELAAVGGAVLYRVVEPPQGPPQPTATDAVAPPGLGVVGRLPRAEPVVPWSLDRDADGAVAVLPDGRVVTLDSSLEFTGELPQPAGCRPLSVARTEGRIWLLCGGGDLLRLEGRLWRPAGRAPGAERLGAADGLWAWGGGGVWRLVDGTARTVAPPPVTAAAAGAEGVAWSDGSRLSVLRRGATAPTIGPELAGISALAWHGPALWAVADGELHRSARGKLPWRRIAGELGSGAIVVGGTNGLWILRPDGVVLEAAALASSPPPWTRPSESSPSGLDQPRGVVVTPEGWIVVADTMHHRLRWYDGDGRWLDDLGAEGTGERAFREPSGLALAPDGRIAVADTWNGRVQVIAPDGAAETVIERLFGPRGVLWGRDGSLLVADTGNRRLLRLEPPSWTAQAIAELPAPVVGLAWVGGLIAAATPADGAVVLLDPASGEVVRRLAVPAWELGDQQEGYVALLPSGELAASAPKHGEIWIIDPAGPTPPRRLRGELPGVTAMAVRDDGTLVASLTWDNRLERVELPR